MKAAKGAVRGPAGAAVADVGTEREHRRRQRDGEANAGAVAARRKGLLLVRPRWGNLVAVGELEQEILISHDEYCFSGR